MPISLTCTACGKRLKAPEKLAGKAVPCPGCKETIHIPLAEDDIAGLLLEPDSLSPGDQDRETSPTEANRTADEPSVQEASARREKHESSDAPQPEASRRKKKLASLPPLGAGDPPAWSRHLHWLLVLALIPLAFSLLQSSDNDDLEIRMLQTAERAGPSVIERYLRVREKENASVDDVMAVMPEQKLIGAFLGRDTKLHWGMAILATVGFMAFLLLLTTYRSAKPQQLFWVGLFTATAGLGFLLLVQKLAMFSRHFSIGGGSIVAVLLYILKFIDFSYQAALNHNNGFILSLVGFTLGVGLCEEVCKALPLLWHYRDGSKQDWHGTFLWGLASGAAFGIGEGIIYAANFYNGVTGPGIYVVRFISCVALHALWTGSVAITINQNQQLLQGHESWHEYLAPILYIVSVPMALHGLYDTLLKREMNSWAMLVAVLSFVYLAFQISRLRGQDDVAANKAMLKEYKRRKAAMGE